MVILEGAGLVKLELHLDGEKWLSQGGRKGEMAGGPTCAIYTLLCMTSKLNIYGGKFKQPKTCEGTEDNCENCQTH